MTTSFGLTFSRLTGLFFAYLTILCALPTQGKAQELQSNGEIRRVVIDAGHGGRDPGTVYKAVREKDITLSVALKLGKLIKKEHPAVEVLYTRDKDVFVELHDRGNFANKKNADLFISIHVNSAGKASAPSGSETFVMGLHKSDENMAVAQRENAVITYENDFSSKYEGYDPRSPESFIIFSLMQNAHLDQSMQMASFVQKELGNKPIKVNRGVKQAGFLVLWKSTMPAILVELGFLSNQTDREIMTSDNGQDKLAECLFKAFSSYKKKYEGTEAAPAPATSTTAAAEDTTTLAANSSSDIQAANSSMPEPKAEIKDSSADVYYSVQIMAVARKLPATSKEFKGEKNVEAVKVGNLYKYMIGNTTNPDDAIALSKRLQKKFNGAFVVVVQNGKVAPLK